MLYTDRQRAKMERLGRRLKKNGYRIYGTNGGFGQPGIFSADYKPVADSEYWLHEFVEGQIRAHHIIKALLTGTTPFEVAGAAAAKQKKKSQRSARSGGVADSALLRSIPTTETTQQEIP